MKRLAILLAQLLILALAVGATGCGGPDAGVAREDGSLRVILRDLGKGASGSATWVEVTVENVGSAELNDFETYLGVDPQYAVQPGQYYRDKYLFETYSTVCIGTSILPGEKYNDTAQIWDVIAMGSIPRDEKPLLVVRASDTQGNSFTVDFTLPSTDSSFVW